MHTMSNYNGATMLEFLLSCTTIAIIAIVWIYIVTAPTNILYPLKEAAYNYLKDFSFGAKILKVLFECEYCLAGQLSFWYFVFTTPDIKTILIAPFITMYLVIILKKVW